MKKLLLVIVFLVAGCIPGGTEQNDALHYRHDAEHSVSCWTVGGYAYVSCLPDSQVRNAP